ncbi:MAG: FAD-dependent oxidoreductase, partial [Tagaea sp.]
MIVLGSGPADQRAAIRAAKLGRKVAVVEHKAVVGGACINTGTIPSKTLREATLHLSGYRERNVYGASYQVKQNITMEERFGEQQQIGFHLVLHRAVEIPDRDDRDDLAVLGHR